MVGVEALKRLGEEGRRGGARRSGFTSWVLAGG